MALNIYKSKSVKRLTEKLSESIRNSQNIFTPEFVVTDNTSIKDWLKVNLAENNGIVANLKFISNDGIADIAYSILEPGNMDILLTVSSLQWKIYKALSNDDFIKAHTKISGYYEDNQLKKYQLSKKLATLIDDYQKYISDDVIKKGSNWQNDIWNHVKDELPEGHIITRNDILKNISALLKDEEKQSELKSKLPVLHLFLGVDFSKFHVDLLNILKNYIDINIYQHDGNEKALVKDFWGRAKQKFDKQFEGSDIDNTEDIDRAEDKEAKAVTLLEHIKTVEKESGKVEIEDDGTISINSCFTPVREVEVLYNNLVKTICESNNVIGARDILVLIPNIDLYTPAIKAVFENAPLSLPYSISDTIYSSHDTVLSTLENILLLDDRFKAEEVFSLLERKQIKDKFEIDDIVHLRELVNLANIRVGRKGKKEKKENETYTVSWKHGISKMIYGYSIGQEDWYPYGSDYKGMLLLDIVEGKTIYDVVRLNNYIDILESCIKEREGEKTLSEWVEYIENIISDFFSLEEEDSKILATLMPKLRKSTSYIDDEVSFNVFSTYMQDLISVEKNKSNFASRGITFCSMQEKKDLPYKVIAVLGLNNKEFPRKTTSLSFDILNAGGVEHNKPTAKENDEYLFLQILQSAEQKLYLSYIGRSAKNNSELSPSSIVESLLDIIKDTTNINVYEFATQHPLHSFSKKYNVENEKYFNYLNPVSEKASEDNSIEKDDDSEVKEENAIKEIDIDDFIAFLKNPIKHYYKNQLGVTYNSKEELLADSEKFELAGLDKWKIIEDLKNVIEESPNKDKEQIISDLGILLKEKGIIPLSNFGEGLLNNALNPYMKLYSDEIKEYNKRTFEEIDLDFGDINLTGRIEDIYTKINSDDFTEKKFVFLPSFSSGSRNVKYMLEFYVKQLILIVSGVEEDSKESKFITNTKSFAKFFYKKSKGDADVRTTNLKYFESKKGIKEAKKELKKLIELYLKGQQCMLPFSTELEISGTVYDDLVEKDFAKVTSRIEKTITSEYRNYTSEELKQVYYNGFFDSYEIIKELGDNTRIILNNVFTKG